MLIRVAQQIQRQSNGTAYIYSVVNGVVTMVKK